MKTREHARITKATYGIEPDHGVLVLEIGCEVGESCWQAFQACVDEKLGPLMVSEVCQLFGVRTIDQLEDRECFVLRCWPKWNEPIEGFEVDGKRWTRGGCVRRHAVEQFRDPFEREAKRIRDAISGAAEKIQIETRELEMLRAGYVDWEALIRDTSDG